ncbi:OmpA family protein [Photobacterium proteolyticum]|nr:OmpA family protein [Photobacterium proteolyticum]
MDLVKWEYKGDHFQCLLNKNVNKFGQVTFRAEPNNKLVLQVRSYQLPKHYKTARLYKLDSPWEQPEQAVTVGGEGAWLSAHEFVFNDSIDELLQAISRGAWMKLSVSSPTQQDAFTVQLPSVRITEPLNAFNRCRSALPAMSYEQARDLVLAFDLGQRVATSDQRASLKQLAEYIKLDQGVQKVLIDGHTDNVGSSLANLQISRVRADDVASFLEEAGVRASIIQVRSHGSRYPVASNASEKGKAKNRRVTIRVIRGGSITNSKVQ